MSDLNETDPVVAGHGSDLEDDAELKKAWSTPAVRVYSDKYVHGGKFMSFEYGTTVFS